MLKRLPRNPIRERSKSGHPRHSLRQGWRLDYPEEFPVTTRPIDWNGHQPDQPDQPDPFAAFAAIHLADAPADPGYLGQLVSSYTGEAR